MSSKSIKALESVISEFRRVSWPARKETAITTGLVVSVATAAAGFFFLVDELVGVIVHALLGLSL